MIARALGKDTRLSAIVPALFLAICAAAVVLMDHGLLPAGTFADALKPHAGVALWALIVLGVAALVWRIGQREGLALAGLGLVLCAGLLAAMTGAGAAYDGARLAAIAAPHDVDGIALVGSRYNGEFTFLARLTQPVAELADAAALQPWLAAHPKGIVLMKEGRGALPWPPADTVDFNGRYWTVWPATAP